MWREVFSDRATLVAAGLAYYAVLGMLPALAAVAVLWSRLGGTQALTDALERSGALLPPAMSALLEDYVTTVPQGLRGGTALAVTLLLVLWTALRAAGGLLTALNLVFDVPDTRPGPVRFGVALCVGLGGIGMLFLAIGVLASAPVVSAVVSGAGPALMWLRWPILVAGFGTSLFLLFRYASDRDDGRAGPSALGAGVAALLWAAASALVALYFARVGSYGRLYGSLGGIAVVLLWLFIGAMCVLAGAAVDAVLLDRLHRRQPGERVRSSTLST